MSIFVDLRDKVKLTLCDTPLARTP